MDDKERLILLNMTPDIGTIRTQRLVAFFGSLKHLFEASQDELKNCDGIGAALSKRIFEGCRNAKALDEELRLAQQYGISIISQFDSGFPKPLKDIYDPPLVIYAKGEYKKEEDLIAVGIVGSRRSSLYGQQVAEKLSYDLAIRGVTIVSGLARGIDASAHKGALKAGGRTIAVLGNGLSSIYPPEHKALADEISKNGALFSEYPIKMSPLSSNFPRRNRIISALSLGVVIVEAAKRSGALITADCALEQGKEVFAIPGKVDSVTSQGTNALLKQGAKLVTCVEDIIEELRLTPKAYTACDSSNEAALFKGLSKYENKLIGLLHRDEPSHLDTLCVSGGFLPSDCLSVLLGLELKHLARQLPGKRFVKTV